MLNRSCQGEGNSERGKVNEEAKGG
jgi:hypothetical protein